MLCLHCLGKVNSFADKKCWDYNKKIDLAYENLLSSHVQLNSGCHLLFWCFCFWLKESFMHKKMNGIWIKDDAKTHYLYMICSCFLYEFRFFIFSVCFQNLLIMIIYFKVLKYIKNILKISKWYILMFNNAVFGCTWVLFMQMESDLKTYLDLFVSADLRV